MTDRELMQQALEAEATEIGHKPPAFHFYLSNLERFAALVAAAEREACAKVCEEPGWNAANWCAKQIRARGRNES